MFVTRRKETLASVHRETKAPAITNLNAYGGFGVSTQPEFDPTILTLINDLNGIHVVANIRGGGEFGDNWHLQATKEKRQNGFDDFIGAAEYLIAQGWTDSNHLFIQGGSNGGTLVTAVANQVPHLFAGVIGQVPVTDMLRYQKFTGGFMWADEYGSSDEGAVSWLIDYSPLHTVRTQLYPAMLIMSGDHDDRVVPLHTYKYVAELQFKLQDVHGQRPIIMKI